MAEAMVWSRTAARSSSTLRTEKAGVIPISQSIATKDSIGLVALPISLPINKISTSEAGKSSLRP